MAKPMLISPISRQGIKLLRVAAYCRVSSSSADQLNSYATQIDYYTRLAKKKKNVTVEIYTDAKTKLTAQDVQKFNAQYPQLNLNYTSKMHDRFLIIDKKTLYHIGASLKDLGKKCFAFEVLDASLIPTILKNL